MAIDPLSTHSAKGQRGPFVQQGQQGLLSRLLRSGSSDPAAAPPVVPEFERATNTIPADTPPPGAGERDRFGRPKGHTTMAPYAKPSADVGRGTLGKVGGWILRVFGVRIAIAIVALILVAIGTLRGDTGSGVDHTSQRLQDAQQRLEAMQDTTTPPVPGPRGRIDVAIVGVDKVDGTAVVVEAASGTRYEWLISNDAIGQAMLDNGFRSVTVFWQIDDAGQAEIVGVSGPNASVRPGGTTVEPGTDANRAPLVAPTAPTPQPSDAS